MGKQNRSLPQQPTSFIGRKNEVAAIINLLQDPECRLLTLIGAGGVGKTRLGFEAADRIVKANIDRASSALFPDGVYLVLLQSVASVTNLMPAIAGALGFEFYDPRHPEKQLTDHLGDQQILLVLDNLEHLPDAADVIDTLLSGASGLKVLATSREPLLLGDEWLFHVDGLPVPVFDAGAFDAFDAVQLFVERARRARYNFSFDDNRACVVQICRLVDGLPLAIELAAAWLRRLSCREIAAEIERNLDILETDMRGVPDRQRSMRAVLDYSWELFSQDECELFMMLSVFQGSFQREAAEQICGASLQTLSALVDKSMVAVLGNGRYQLHELQRQYGAEKLGKETELETAVRDRHCEYFTTFMDRPFRDYWGYRGKETLQEIDAEIDNVLAAWNWAVAQGRYSDLHSCIDGLLPYWYHRWHEGVEEAYHEGLIALRSAEPGPERDLTMGWALAHQSSLDLWMVRLQYAKERAAESIVLLEPLNARHELAHAYGARARAACWGQDRDPEQAQALVQEAVALFEETGQYELQGLMYTMLGYLNYDIGDLEESEKWFQKDNELSRRTADPLGETRSLGNLGRHALVLGRYDQAGQYLMESLKIARDLKNKSWINEALNRLGLLAEAVGDLETAEHTFQECLAGAKEWGKPYSIALSMTNLASVVVARKEYALATALYQESPHFFQGNGMIQADRLCGLGRIAFEEQQYAQARRLYEESLRICKESGFRLQQARNVDALGRIALAQGLVWEAQAHFRAAVEESIALGAPPVMLECMISTGELFAHEGDEKEAAELAMLVRNHPASRAESVERAVRLLKEIETAVSVEELQANQSAAGDDLESVLAKLPDRLTPTEGSAAAASGATLQPLLDPLSERELELLRLVAAGKSNREIAAELVLALGTVKSHLHNIFQKLDAGSRTQAVVRAQELDLL